METTEVKLTQQLAQVPLYGVFIDLKKVYDTMDMDRCMGVLNGYGGGGPERGVEISVLAS